MNAVYLTQRAAEAESLSEYCQLALACLAGRGVAPRLRPGWRDTGEDWQAALAMLAPAAPADAGSTARVLATPGPTAVIAAFYAAATGRSLAVRDEPSIDEHVEVFVLPVARATDALLFQLLQRPRERVAAHAPWRSAIVPSILTARDPAALSALVARIVADAGSEASDAVIEHVAPDDEGATLSRLRMSATAHQVSRHRLGGAELIQAYAAPADVRVFRTHGSEACANGADGVVLCGRHPNLATIDVDAPGVLSCGRGHGCARGPNPVPLRNMAAKILMLGTCNGLRLADSLNQPEFNFALSAVDGTALGYVSSAFTSSGGDLAALAFPAALASGMSLGEATALINVLLAVTGVEQPAYLALGDGRTRLRPAAPLLAVPMATVAEELDLGEHFYAEIEIGDPEVVAQVRTGALGLCVESAAPDGSVFGFPLLEASGHGSAETLRMIVVGFPHPIGVVTLVPVRHDAIHDRIMGQLADLDRWIELWRLTGLRELQAEDYRVLCDERDRFADQVAASLAVLRVGGSGTLGRIRRQLSAGGLLIDFAMASTMEELTGRLGGSFWLPNTFTPVQQRHASSPTRCAGCGGPAFTHDMRHALGRAADARAVTVCPRCGITSDIAASSPIRGIEVLAPAVATAGEPFEVSVTVELGEESAITIRPRLCAHGHAVPAPEPAERTVTAAGTNTVTFVFDLAADVLPHRHYVKVLLAGRSGISFGCRPFFVAPGRPPIAGIPIVAANG